MESIRTVSDIIRFTRKMEVDLNWTDLPHPDPKLPEEAPIIDVGGGGEKYVGTGRNFRIVEWHEEHAFGIVQAELTVPEQYKAAVFVLMHDEENVFEILTCGER